ncbi:MAG: M15 family metallopeptidase [Bacteroidota bacterium]
MKPSKKNPAPSPTQKVVSQLPQGFVYLADIDPTIRQDVRYAGKHNFVGRPIKGYKKATVILSHKAAQALAAVQAALQKDSRGKWTLMVYDGYRPQQAVNDFWHWSQDMNDQVMKAEFYPAIASKNELFKQGYVDRKSGHSRGSTVDLTIVSIDNQRLTPLDMGSPFDLFDAISHYASDRISLQAQQHRKYLRSLMMAHGFAPYEKEWWHFTLRAEPFPNTYFDFPVQ